MCGRQIGNLLFPLVVSGVLTKGLVHPSPFNPVQVKPLLFQTPPVHTVKSR